jgi:hypothetical protein
MVWAPDYVSVAELRDFRSISDSADDALLALAIAAASRAIDRHTNRQFGSVATAEERTYPAKWDRRRSRWLVETDDFMTTVGLEIGGVPFSADLHRLEPLNAAQLGKPWEAIVLTGSPGDESTVEALWGWTAVPDAVKQATLLQASRLASRRKSPYGVAGSPELGSELRLLARVDPDVAVSLGPFIRWWGAA